MSVKCPQCKAKLDAEALKWGMVKADNDHYYQCPTCACWLRKMPTNDEQPKTWYGQLFEMAFTEILAWVLGILGIAAAFLMYWYSGYLCIVASVILGGLIIWAIWTNEDEQNASQRFELWTPRCSACGYDMQGLPRDHDCPECGHAPPQHPSTLKNKGFEIIRNED